MAKNAILDFYSTMASLLNPTPATKWYFFVYLGRGDKYAQPQRVI